MKTVRLTLSLDLLEGLDDFRRAELRRGRALSRGDAASELVERALSRPEAREELRRAVLALD